MEDGVKVGISSPIQRNELIQEETFKEYNKMKGLDNVTFPDYFPYINDPRARPFSSFYRFGTIQYIRSMVIPKKASLICTTFKISRKVDNIEPIINYAMLYSEIVDNKIVHKYLFKINVLILGCDSIAYFLWLVFRAQLSKCT